MRPTSGSGLSLSIPSQHAALYDPGEFVIVIVQSPMPSMAFTGI